MKKTLLLLFMTSCLLHLSIAKKDPGRLGDGSPKNAPAATSDIKKGGNGVTITKTPTIPGTKTPEKGNKELPPKDKPAAKPKPPKSAKKQTNVALDEEAYRAFLIDSVNKSFTYRTDNVDLNEQTSIAVPAGFKYLDGKQSRFILEKLWGNLPDSSFLGMLIPAHYQALDTNLWAFVIQYSETGHIDDKDADDINYDDLLAEIQKGDKEDNEVRKSMGLSALYVVGWANPPFYDKEKKTLHWAKELRTDESERHTLNYDIRVLGRNGLLSLNAVGGMEQMELIKPEIDKIISAVAFKDGKKYSDFDPAIDKVAAVGIGGLIAGKVLAKAGFFAVLAKFGKVIIAGIVAFAGGIWRFLTGRKKEE